MDWLTDTKIPVGRTADAASAWITANPDALVGWLAGVTAKDGGDGIAAVKAALGL